MTIQKPLLLSFALSTAIFAGSALAGTAGLTGNYTGTYNLEVRTDYNALMARGVRAKQWTFDFSNQQAHLSQGTIRAIPFPFQFNYIAYSPMPLIDNGDGTYTVTYDFQVFNPLYGNPRATTTAHFDITELSNGELKVSTLDSDNDGVIGQAIRGAFPYTIELNWFGNAKRSQ